MNISVLAPIKPSDIWNVPISYVLEFRRLGHDVRTYNTIREEQPGISLLDPRAWTEDGLKQLLEDAKSGDFKPDIIIHFDFGLFKSSLLTKKSYPSCPWFYESGDDPQCFNYNLAKAETGNFDLIFSPDIRTTQMYLNKGHRAVWSPHFADETFLGENILPSYDSITSRHCSEPFFVELKKILKDDFFARDAFINEKDHLSFLKKGKMVVQNSKYKEITRRIFEGMLCNRLVITDRPSPATRIDLLFEENKDIVYFDSVEECAEKIKFYAQNETERLAISESGYRKVKNNHTISKRASKLLNCLSSI
jgi:hypothetical protein